MLKLHYFLISPVQKKKKKKKSMSNIQKSIFGALCSLWKLETPTLEHYVGDEVCRALRDGNRFLEIVIFYEL